jgi:hypothetical protein
VIYVIDPVNELKNKLAVKSCLALFALLDILITYWSH